MGIKRTASSRQIDLGMQNQWFLSILQHKMQKTKLPYFSLYFWADSFENLKCPATAHFLTENSEIFSGSLFLITTGLVNSPWWNSTKLQILDTLMNKLNRTYKRFSPDSQRKKSAKKEYRAAVRLYYHKSSVERDERLAEVLSKNPNKFYRYMIYDLPNWKAGGGS